MNPVETAIESPSWLFALGLFAGIILILELGRRVGAPQRVRSWRAERQASARFDGRREQIVQEANNIGTAWLRIDLLPP